MPSHPPPIPTVLVTGSPASGKSSFASTLRHLTASKRLSQPDRPHVPVNVLECRDDQVESWVRRNKPRQHILCIYLLKPTDFPLLQPPTTAFDTLLRLRALARPDSPPPYSPQSSINFTHNTPPKGRPTTTTTQLRRRSSNRSNRSGILIVLPVLSKADCFTSAGLERARKDCLAALSDEWEPEIPWNWGFVPPVNGERRRSSECYEKTKIDDDDGQRVPQPEGGRQQKQPQDLEQPLWNIINPDWSELALQRKIKVPSIDFRLMRPSVPPQKDDGSPSETATILSTTDGTTTVVPSTSSSTQLGSPSTSKAPVGALLDCLASVAASLPPTPNPKHSTTHSALEVAHISPSPSSSSKGKQASTMKGEEDIGMNIDITAPTSTPSVSPQHPDGDGCHTHAQEPSELYREAYDLFAREYPWGKCYPLDPTHSDLAKLIHWTEEKIDEMSKEPVLERGDSEDTLRSIIVDDLAVDPSEDVLEHSRTEEDQCIHSPCMLSTCSGDHHGLPESSSKENERVVHVEQHRSASTGEFEQGRVRAWARQQSTSALPPSFSLKGKRGGDEDNNDNNERREEDEDEGALDAGLICLSESGEAHHHHHLHQQQRQAQAHQGSKSHLLRTVSTPITAFPASVSSQSPGPSGPAGLSSNPNRQSRAPYLLSLEPKDLPDGPPPPPLLSPSGRRWPGAPASTTGLSDDSYPNSHPRRGFREEIMDLGGDWRTRAKLAQINHHLHHSHHHHHHHQAPLPLPPPPPPPPPQPQQQTQLQSELKVECDDSAGATYNSSITPGIASAEGAVHQAGYLSSSSASSCSHTHPPSNRLITLDPQEGAEISNSSTHAPPGPASISISNCNSQTTLPGAACLPSASSSHPSQQQQQQQQQLVKPPKPRKPKAQLACTFCRTRKLRCAPSASSSKFCGECDKRGIVCEGPGERENRKRREMEEAAAIAAATTGMVPAAAPGTTEPTSGSSASSSKDISSGGKSPLIHAVPPKIGAGDQTPYITGPGSDLGVIPQAEVSDVRRETLVSDDRDDDGYVRDGRRTLGSGLALDASNSAAAKGNGNNVLTRASQVVSLDAPSSHNYQRGPAPMQTTTYGARTHHSLFPPIQPKDMSRSDREASSPPPPHVRRHSYGDEERRFYAPPPRDRPPSRGYGSERELPPPGPTRAYYGPPPPTSAGEFYAHPNPGPHYRRGSSPPPPPPRRHSDFRRTLPSPPPGLAHNQSAPVSHYAPHHHYPSHPPAVPSQNSPPGSLHVPYGHPAPHQQGMSHGRSHSHSHPHPPRPYIPPLSVPPHAMAAAAPAELIPSHLPPPPGPYSHMAQTPGRPLHPEEFSPSLNIANMNRMSKRIKEEQKHKNPSSRSGPKVVACNHCRARKTRCDGETPCSNCSKRNLSCQYQLSAREAARRKRAQAADLASRAREAYSASVSGLPDSPRSAAPTLQPSPGASRASSVEPLGSGGMGGGSPASLPFTPSYRHGASPSPVLHRAQHPSTSLTRDIQLAPVSAQGSSHSPRMSLPPIASFTSPPSLRTTLPEPVHSDVKSLKRPRSPDHSEERERSSSNPPLTTAAETSQSQSKRMRVDALID